MLEKNYIKKNKLNTLIIILMNIIFFLSFFLNYDINGLIERSRLFILTLFSIMLFILNIKKNLNIKYLYIYIILYSLLILLSYKRNILLNSNFIIFISLILWFNLFNFINFDKKSLNILFYIDLIIFLFFIFSLKSKENELIIGKFLFIKFEFNKNTFSLILIYIYFYLCCLFYEKIKKLVIVFTFIVIYFLIYFRSLNSCLIILFYLICLILPTKLLKNKFFNIILFLFLSIFPLLITKYYLNMIKFINLFIKLDVSLLDGRDLIWNSIWEEFLKNPFTGINVRNIAYIGTHNSMLSIFVSFGWLIFCLFLLIFFLNFIKIKVFLNYGLKGKLFYASYVSFFIGGFFENNLTSPYSFIMYIFIALMFSYINDKGEIKLLNV